MSASAPAPRSPRRRSRALGALAAGGVVALALLAGCSSGSNPGTSATVPDRSTTTTVEKATTTTEKKDTTTTGKAATTTTAGVTTTTAGGSTTTTKAGDTTTTTARPATTTTSEKPATTTTEKATTTTEKKDTTTTTAAATTSSLDTTLVDSKQDDVPWLAIGALVAVAVLVLVLALRNRAQRGDWWNRADALTREGRAVVDLGTAGPAGAEPQQEIAHWATIEQRTEAFNNQLAALSARGVPDDATRGALGALTQATTDYLAALRTSRTLRIGPPSPTAEQLQYADAESAQRLAIVRASLDQLDQLVLPHRKTP